MLKAPLLMLADTEVTTIVVEHRDRLKRFGTDYVEAAMAASGRRLPLIMPVLQTVGRRCESKALRHPVRASGVRGRSRWLRAMQTVCGFSHAFMRP